MTDQQRGYIQAPSDVRSWHSCQIGQSLGDIRALQAHEMAIAWLDKLIAAKKRHAVEDEAHRQRARARTHRPAALRSDSASSGSRGSGRT